MTGCDGSVAMVPSCRFGCSLPKSAGGGPNAEFWLRHAQHIDLMLCVTEPVSRRSQ